MILLFTNRLDAASYVSIDDQIVEAKKFITKIVHSWNTTLLELDQLLKKYEKQQREMAKKIPIKTLPSGDPTADLSTSFQNDYEGATSMYESSAYMPTHSVDPDETNAENGLKLMPPNDDETSRRSGVLKFFSNFLPNSENDSFSLKSPFHEDEHLQILGKYTINRRELSSIIAHAMSMSEYDQRLNDELSCANNENASESNAEVKQQENEAENADENDTNHQHIELHFHDSSTKFTVKIFYAAKFHLLRQLIFTGQDETSYIRSLSRCKKLQPRGGKSKSEFWQTVDDYFVLKDLNQKESLSFATFAPSYIDYVSNSLRHNRPVTLAKIFGIYHIQYRQNSTGENFKRDILVLENLLFHQNLRFHSTIPPTIYDLKGSMRNRLVIVEEGQTNPVLLDENFLTQTQENPCYVRLHTKWTLLKALNADTQFLSKHGIVDYSLLVSYHPDDPQSIIYAGIIDYIRTYTWDKKIETIVKSMSVVGPTPTVISPENYRTRFLRRMDQYFPVVPDEWHGYEKKFLDLSLFQTETLTANSNSNEIPTQ